MRSVLRTHGWPETGGSPLDEARDLQRAAPTVGAGKGFEAFGMPDGAGMAPGVSGLLTQPTCSGTASSSHSTMGVGGAFPGRPGAGGGVSLIDTAARWRPLGADGRAYRRPGS